MCDMMPERCCSVRPTEASTVSITRCESYSLEIVRTAFRDLLRPLGGMEALVKPGLKVLVKPNMLAAAPPEEAVTTHPAVVQAVVETVLEVGSVPLVGDSPAGSSLAAVSLASGIQEVVNDTGASRLDLTAPVSAGSGADNAVPLARELDQMDLIINVAKLKTHALTGLTACVKNCFGLIPGSEKRRLHFRYPLPLAFSDYLLETYLRARPALNVLDAVIAMEGPGPRKGRPRRAGLLLAGVCGVSVDAAASAAAGLHPRDVPTLVAAGRRGLQGSDPRKIQVVGTGLDRARISGFDPGPAASSGLFRALARFPLAALYGWRHRRRPYPLIARSTCTGCGRCVKMCPPQAMSGSSGTPRIRRQECIRCYCCQEVCPEGAVQVGG